MPKVIGERLHRVHIQLYESDWDFLLLCYGDNLKRSKVVRDIVRDFIAHVKAKEEQRARATTTAMTKSDDEERGQR